MQIRRKKVLVAEDDELNFILIREYLLEHNFEILWATDGIEAIEFCKKHPDIDFVFMDINMPRMNGYKASTEIKLFRPLLPIIAYTANEIEKNKREIFTEYLNKPVSQKQILGVVERYLS